MKFAVRYTLLILFVLVSCEREYDYSVGTLNGTAPESYPFLLPINFGEYNCSQFTKSSEDTNYRFDFNPTMLDSVNSIQKEIKPGVIYTQTPLKGRLFCKTISKYLSSVTDSIMLTPAKMFHIKKEFCIKDSLIERIITMIPETKYYENNSQFSYLDMPGFTGTIITSSLDGNPIDVWGVRNGYIGLGRFSKDAEDSVFARLEFTDSPYSFTQYDYATKSSMDDTLDVCRVVARYTMKHGFVMDLSLAWFVDPVKGPPTTQWQYPSGGGPLPDELEGSVYYTATVNSKFCNEEISSSNLSCIANSNLELVAKSSSSDSCIFFCWKSEDGVVSYTPKLVVTMDKNYTFTTIYTSINDKDCYSTAKIVTDTLWQSKIDSLRAYTNRTKRESGLARRSGGDYYQLKGGTENNIRIDLEYGTTYTNVDHTHPNNNCIPSGADLCQIFKNIGRFSRNQTFSFGIITENEMMILKIDDIDKSLKFLEEINRVYGNEYSQVFFEENYIVPTLIKMNTVKESDRHMICLQELLPFFSEMGFSVGYSINNDINGSFEWYNAVMDNDGSVILDRCF